MKRCLFLCFILLAASSKGNSIPCPPVANGSNQWQLVDRVSNCLDATNACIIGTSIMQADVDSAGGTYVISQAGIYTVCEDLMSTSDTIQIMANDVTLNLNNHTVASTGDGECILLGGFSNIKIYNGRCSGPGVVIAGITIGDNNKDVEISNITFFNLAAGINASLSQNIIIRSCEVYDFASPNQNGIQCVTCDAVVIEDCTIFSSNHIAANGIIITDPQANGAIIRRCIVQKAVFAGISIQVVSSGTLDACLIEDCSVANITNELPNGIGYLILDQITGDTGCIIVRCLAEGCDEGFAITASNVVVEECISRRNNIHGYGIFAIDSLFDNCIAHANGVNGFLIDLSAFVTFASCEATGNGDVGFAISAGNTHIVIERSLASANTGSGIDNGAGASTTIVNTYSSSITPPTYQLNGLADNFNGATIIP